MGKVAVDTAGPSQGQQGTQSSRHAHPRQIGAIHAAVQGWHHDVIIWGSNVGRVSDQGAGTELLQAFEEAAVKDLRRTNHLSRCSLYLLLSAGDCETKDSISKQVRTQPYLVLIADAMGSSAVPCCGCSRWADLKAMDDPCVLAPCLQGMDHRRAISCAELYDLHVIHLEVHDAGPEWLGSCRYCVAQPAAHGTRFACVITCTDLARKTAT